MSLHIINGPSQQTGDNTHIISGETCQVNALLHIIKTLQAQSEGLSVEQQKTIEELKGRVKELTEKQNFLESELLAEKKKSAEFKKQHKAQEKALMQREQARLEAAQKVNEEKRRLLEAEKARKRAELLDIQNNHYGNYSLAKDVFQGMTDNQFYRKSARVKWYPEDHFMEPIYKGTENISGTTIHLYEIWKPSCEPSRYQYLLNHFQNVMNHYKSLFDEAKSQRDALV